MTNHDLNTIRSAIELIERAQGAIRPPEEPLRNWNPHVLLSQALGKLDALVAIQERLSDA
jgi:hypothetical protein